jgi:hypothetical protein
MQSVRLAGDNALLRAACAPSRSHRAARACFTLVACGVAIGGVWFACVAWRAGAW